MVNWLVRVNRSMPVKFGKLVSSTQNLDVVIIGKLVILCYLRGYEICWNNLMGVFNGQGYT